MDELGSSEDRPSADEAELIGLYVGDVLTNKCAAIAAHLSQTTDFIADDPFRNSIISSNNRAPYSADGSLLAIDPMKRIDVLGFEQKSQRNIDPWNYTTSRFEHFERDALLQACGHNKHGRVLVLGCAIGETTRFLGSLSLRLLALDGSPTAISEAKKRVRASYICFLLAVLPMEMPRGRFDLIVVSEVAYCLRAVDLVTLAKKISLCVTPHGKIVLLQDRRLFPDAAQPGELAQAYLTRLLRSIARPVYRQRYPGFDVVVLLRSEGRRRVRQCPRNAQRYLYW